MTQNTQTCTTSKVKSNTFLFKEDFMIVWVLNLLIYANLILYWEYIN